MRRALLGCVVPATIAVLAASMAIGDDDPAPTPPTAPTPPIAATATRVAPDDRPLLTARRTLSGHTRLVRCLAYASDGTLASGGQDRRVCLWSPAGELLRSVDLQPGGG